MPDLVGDGAGEGADFERGGAYITQVLMIRIADEGGIGTFAEQLIPWLTQSSLVSAF